MSEEAAIDTTTPIAVASPLGRRLLAEATNSQYDILGQCVRPQRGRSSCALAAAALVCRSLGTVPADETAVLAAQRGPAPLLDTKRGVPLADLARLFENLGFRRVATTHVGGLGNAEASEARIVDAIRAALASRDRRVVLNFSLDTVGLGGRWGHHAVAAAYHAPSNRVCVLDAPTSLRPWAGPVWLDAGVLVRAMATHDYSSGVSRGFVVVGL